MAPFTWLVGFYVLLADITKPNINQKEFLSNAINTASSVNLIISNDLWKLYQFENNLFTTFALIASIWLSSSIQKVNRGGCRNPACWTAGSGYCTMSLFWGGGTISNVWLKFCYFVLTFCCIWEETLDIRAAVTGRSFAD